MGSVEISRRDGLSSTTAYKGPCRVATTGSITLFGTQTVDGVALAEGDRVLVTGNGIDNGIWIVVANGAWRRAADWNKAGDIARGTRVWVTAGNNGPAEMEVSSLNPIPGVTAVTFDLSAGNVNAAALSAAMAAAVAAAVAAGVALDAIAGIVSSVNPITEYPFTVSLGQTSVTIPGGYDVIGYVLLEGLHISGWTAPGGGVVTFPAITTDDTAGEATAEMIVGVGKTPIVGFDTLDGGSI